MHVFQPISVDFVEFNPFTKIGKDWMLITAGNELKANTMTASWGGCGVLWNKNVVFIFVRDSRYTKEFLDRQDRFSLSFMEESSKATLKYLGAVSGRDEDKIKNARLHINYQDDTPFIDDAKIVITCRKLCATKLTPDQFIDPTIAEINYKTQDYHTMYVGEILTLMAR